MVKRIDSIVLQAVVTSYDENGHPIHEDLSQQLKLFRAKTTDIWTHLDELLAQTKEPNGSK